MRASEVRVHWSSERGLGRAELLENLRRFGDMLPDPLGARMDLETYAEKLLARADVALAQIDGEIVGMVVLYANDRVCRAAHIPMVAVAPQARRRGVGAALISRALARARARGMETLNLEVRADNETAVGLYRSLRFRERTRNGPRLMMQVEIPQVSDASLVPTTPLESRPDLAAAFDLDIDLKVKRDDLYPSPGGGTKARKIGYILREAVAHEHDVLVTNGGPQSNHARATAIEAARLGLKCHLVVVTEPGRHYRDAGNILLMRLSGAALEFRQKAELGTAMDAAMATYAAKGFNPLYVWGGGHCLAGTVAFVDAAAELRAQTADWRPEFLVIASGTGSTQAGLAIGLAYSGTRVLGISVARDGARGGLIVNECVKEYQSHIGGPSPRIEFLDEWVDGGYERAGDYLLSTIRCAAQHGFFLDPTYSGKAWMGLVDLTRRGYIPPGSKVVFWHSGGLMNLQASCLAGPEFNA